jgi:hypothetical protein
MSMRSAFLFCGGVLSFCVLSSALNAEEAEKTLTVKGSPVKAAISEQRPDYLHFKEVKITREGKQRLSFDITLQGEMPKNPKDSVSIYFGFDIDEDPATGSVAAHAPGFGQDVGFYIYQNQGDTRFLVHSNSVMYKGKLREIDVSGLKVRGDKIEVKVRSELFSFFDSFKFFLSASIRPYSISGGTSETQVHTTPITKF